MHKVEKHVAYDRNFRFTILSYSTSAAIFVNLSSINSPFAGLIASVVYFFINTVFLGQAFFGKEGTFLRLTLGLLLLFMLLGFVGWLVMIIYDLDTSRLALVLFITTTLSSLFNRRMASRNAGC